MLAFRQNTIFGVITLLVLIPFLLGWPMPSGLDVWILIISLVITGIPHGAIDHVIFLKNQDNNQRKNSLFSSFFVPYLLMIGLTFFLWFIVPEIMFWFFLTVAAYHFGQSQLYYLNLSDSSKYKTPLYLLWGIYILSSLWLFHWEAQSIIIQSVFNWNLEVGGFLYQVIFMATITSGLGIFLMIFTLFLKGILPLKMIAQEIIVLMLLTALFYYTPPYIAFAIYFGIWHSARVILTEYHFLKIGSSAPISFNSFFKSFLPFSLLSFVGLGILFWVSQLLKANISPFMLFLIFISALTMPHAFFMEKMYKLLGNSYKRTTINAV
jgi:Brp/Blh family beta-carotene 15,15'-monooxygenase